MKEIVVYALLLAASASAAFGQDACGSARKLDFKREMHQLRPLFQRLDIFCYKLNLVVITTGSL